MQEMLLNHFVKTDRDYTESGDCLGSSINILKTLTLPAHEYKMSVFTFIYMHVL